MVSVGWGECEDDGAKVMMASSLPSLRSLDISDNNISEAGLDLRSLPQLTRLSLGQRSLTSLTSSLLDRVSVTLASLELTGALELTSIRTASLGRLVNLVNITITDNPSLSVIEPGILGSGGTNDLNLDLSRNSLQRLDPASLPWTRVKTLQLSGNPLQCDCRLAWLSEALSITPQHNATCRSPSHVSGAQLSELTELSTCHSLETWHVALLVTLASSLLLLMLGLTLLVRCRNRPKTAGVRDLAPPSYLLRAYGTGDSGDTSVYWDYRAMDTEISNKEAHTGDMKGPYTNTGLYGTLHRPGTVARAQVDSARLGTMQTMQRPYYDPEYMPGPAHQLQLPGVYATLLPQARSKTLTAHQPQQQQKPGNKFWKVLSSTGGRKSESPESVYTLDSRGMSGNIYTGNPGSRFPDPESSVQMLTYSQPDIVYFDLLRGVGAQN